MSEETKGGKWAAEVYDFLLLFRKLNSSVFGLLILEIGWILFLILLTKLSPSGGNQPITATITIPFYKSIQVTSLFLPGAIICAVIWLIGSGILLYPGLLLSRFFRWVLIRLVYFEAVLQGIFAFLFLPLIWPLEIFFSHRWLNSYSKEEKQNLKDNLINIKKAEVDFENYLKKAEDYLQKRDEKSIDPLKKTDLNYEDLSNNRIKIAQIIGIRNYNALATILFKEEHTKEELDAIWDKIGERALKEKSIENSPVSRTMVLSAFRDWRTKWLRIINSRTVIGLAPLQTFNYQEEMNEAKAPAQIYSTAIERLRWQLATWEILPHVEFTILPPHFIPKNSRDTSRLRRWLGLDLLLWGSYLTGEPSSIWLNMDRQLRKDEIKEQEEKSKKQLKEDNDLFYSQLNEININSLVIDQRNVWDIYIILILSLIQLINSRQAPRDFPLDKHTTDILKYSGREVDHLVSHLVEDAFMGMDNKHYIEQKKNENNFSLYPRTGHFLVRLAGKWAGGQLSNLSLHKEEDIRKLAPKLEQILQKCIEFEPTIIENYYRLGAVYCLLNEPDKAISTYYQAQQFVTAQERGLSSLISAGEHIALEEVIDKVTPDIEMIRYTAYVARAINIGHIRSYIQKSFEETSYGRIESHIYADGGLKPPAAFQVLQTLFDPEKYPEAKPQ